MTTTNHHPFHMVTLSPWPMLTSINIMNMFMGFTLMMYLKTTNILIISMITMILCLTQWWRDVIRESTFQGFHTLTVTKLIKMSMILFIVSELMFFTALFWTYFHSSIAPSIEIGMPWPPLSIKQMNPYNIPLLNSQGNIPTPKIQKNLKLWMCSEFPSDYNAIFVCCPNSL